MLSSTSSRSLSSTRLCTAQVSRVTLNTVQVCHAFRTNSPKSPSLKDVCIILQTTPSTNGNATRYLLLVGRQLC